MANPYAGSLFERLAGTQVCRIDLAREEHMTASVAAHLTRMFGTRAGSVQALPDYGLPDLNDMNRSLHDLVTRSCSAIESFIQTYEPRLSDVRVLVEPGYQEGPQLQFIVEGVLVADDIKRRVQFSAALGGNGKVFVRSG